MMMMMMKPGSSGPAMYDYYCSSGWSSSYCYCSSDLLHVCKERRNDVKSCRGALQYSSEESKVVNFIESCMTNMAASATIGC